MNPRCLAKIIGVVCIIFFALPHLVIASQDNGDGAITEVKYTAQFSEADLSFGKLDVYDLIHMRNASVFSILGKPVLPKVNIKLAIPAETEVVEIQVRSLNSLDIPGEFYVMPGQPPLKTSETSSQLSVEPDYDVYGSNSLYPDKLTRFANQGDLAGQEIVDITIYPVQYVPKDRKLIFNKSVELIVKCRPAKVHKKEFAEQYYRFTENQHKIYDKMIKKMVVNPEDVVLNPPKGEQSPVLATGHYDHIIITSDDFAPYFQPLVDWHKKKGLRDKIVTKSWIMLNYGGCNYEHIRNFIIDAHTSWGTMYFLLGGGHSVIPFNYYYYQCPPCYGKPSDQYYSDFDDDWYSEVFVGRAPVDLTSQVSTFINKVMQYEKDPPLNDYPLDILLIGMDADDITLGEDLKEIIDSYIPEQFNVTKVYDSDPDDHEEAAKAALNAGQNLVNHADHADWYIIGTGYTNHNHSGIDRYEVDDLYNDNEPSIIVSYGCFANAMQYGSICIAGHFVLHNPNQAGVAFTGNTMSGWYYPGDPVSLSGELDKLWWQGVFDEEDPMTDLGMALNWSRHQFSNDDSDEMKTEWVFNLLGEPAMPIWTDTPEEFQVTHPFSLSPVGTQDFDVIVEDEGGYYVEEAVVCIWKDDEDAIYEVETTGPDGEVIFIIDPLIAGRMYVTVTKHNYLPYEGSAIVTDFAITGEVFESDGITPVLDPGVIIDNLDDTEAEWQANVDAGSNRYALGLDGSDIPDVGDILRIIAKKELDEGIYDPDEYTYTINITDREVTQDDISIGGINEDLNLNHYCINYYPDYHYFTQGEWNYSGAAVMQMWTDFKEEGPYTQTELHAAGLDNNTEADKSVGLEHIDPQGMALTLKDIIDLPPGHTFTVGVMPGDAQGLNWAMHRICWWQYTGPGALPTGDDYSMWMSVRGIHTDKRPQDGIYAGPGDWEYEVYGFWVNDPDNSPSSLGANSYKTADEWTSLYYTLIIDPNNPQWNGKYITVLEPPEYDAQIHIAQPILRFTEQQINALGAIIDQNVILGDMRSWIIQAAINGVTEELIPYDENFKTVFEKTHPGEPFFVTSIDGDDYYTVPFIPDKPTLNPKAKIASEIDVDVVTKIKSNSDIKSTAQTKSILNSRDGKVEEKIMALEDLILVEARPKITVVILINAQDGSFKEASWTEEPSAYLPLSKTEARQIAFDAAIEYGLEVEDIDDLKPELIHRQASPYYPEWLVIIGEYGIFISQDGTVSIEGYSGLGSGPGGPQSEDTGSVLTYGLNTALPTPFIKSTMISYSIARPGHVSLAIYDVCGRLVKTLVNTHMDAGVYNLQWNGYDNNNQRIPSGVYFTRLASGEFTSVKKTILAR